MDSSIHSLYITFCLLSLNVSDELQLCPFRTAVGNVFECFTIDVFDGWISSDVHEYINYYSMSKNASGLADKEKGFLR